MNRHRCERTWQAEAREDGRLDKRDLASFERHAAQCRECTAEMNALRNITQKMSSLPEPLRSDLEHRRARNELLRRANEQFLTPAPSSKGWKTWAVAGAIAFGAAGVFGLRFAKNTSHTAHFEVSDVTNAVWHSETTASTSTVTLQSGTAAFHVEHLEQGTRFWVDMPDGRIEVRGTRFVVEVSQGQTKSVEVTEGIVWLDVPTFHGLLHAGERWPRPTTIGAMAAPSSAPIQADAPAPTIAPPSSATTLDNVTPPSMPVPNPPSTLEKLAPTENAPSVTNEPPPAASSAATPKDEAGPRFAEAMTAFTSGNDAKAEQLFAAFVRDFPRDGRAEDAMFLRAKLRARQGDSAGAAALARQYLQAYPRGFRRPEAERLAGTKSEEKASGQ